MAGSPSVRAACLRHHSPSLSPSPLGRLESRAVEMATLRLYIFFSELYFGEKKATNSYQKQRGPSWQRLGAVRSQPGDAVGLLSARLRSPPAKGHPAGADGTPPSSSVPVGQTCASSCVGPSSSLRTLRGGREAPGAQRHGAGAAPSGAHGRLSPVEPGMSPAENRFSCFWM